jgi:hypothetical protein
MFLLKTLFFKMKEQNTSNSSSSSIPDENYISVPNIHKNYPNNDI